MTARAWTPSARASQLIAALWDAFLDGDRIIAIQHPSTARMTGNSLVHNGIAEWVDIDVAYTEHRRIRLADAYLEANDITDRDWRTEAEGFAAWDAEEAAA